jgi:transcriptional regulator with XRE-family HTH domain
MNRLLRERREQAMLTQEELAHRVGVSDVTVRRWERGQRPYPVYLRKLCRVLGAQPAELGFGQGAGPEVRGRIDVEDDVKRREFLKTAATIGTALAIVPKALTPVLGKIGATEFDQVRLAVGRVIRFERASQYSAARAVLPTVLQATDRLVQDVPDEGRRLALVLASQSRAVSAWVHVKDDRTAEALAAAEKAIEAARQADDPILVGAGLRCLGEVHMRAGRFGLASDLSIEAAEFVGRSDVGDQADALCIRGAGYLSAAMACARSGDDVAAEELLNAAAACARELGQDLSGVAVFGPTNVLIHRVAVPMDLGDALTALRRAEGAPISPSAGMEERHGRYLIDLARAHSARRRDAEAAEALLQAEAVAAEEVRGHRLTRSVLTELLGRERRGAIPELRSLAERSGALA